MICGSHANFDFSHGPPGANDSPTQEGDTGRVAFEGDFLGIFEYLKTGLKAGGSGRTLIGLFIKAS